MHAVPPDWLLLLRHSETAPLQPYTTPRKFPQAVRFPWER